MRLQLKIQRPGLPSTQLLWNTEGLRPNASASGFDSTVAQLLEQVDEVVPLEGADWGLEDYVVEVHHFECLHFCLLRQVLKEDDEVTIRPLRTSDIRQRRISGRHQISTDGKHLIDGVAFGRPFLRRIDRPSIKLISREHANLKDLPNGDAPGLVNPSSVQLVVRATVNDEEISNSNYEGEDEEFDRHDGELHQELSDLINDQSLEGMGSKKNTTSTPPCQGFNGKTPTLRSQKRKRNLGLGIVSNGISDFLNDNSVNFGLYHNPLLDDYYDDLPQALESSEGGRNSEPNNWRTKDAGRLDIGSNCRASSGSSAKSVRFFEEQLETPATIRELGESNESSDGDFAPETTSNSSHSNKENVEPDSQSSSMSSGDSDETSSSDSSNTNSNSSSYDISTSISNNRSSSYPEYDDALEVDPVSAIDKNFTISGTSKTTKQTNLRDSFNRIPGQGLTKTKNRNERRRLSKRLTTLKELGILPASATLQQCKEWGETHSSSEARADISTAFEAKKLSLLTSIASGDNELAALEASRASLPSSNDLQFKEKASAKRLFNEGETNNPIAKSQSTDHQPLGRQKYEVQLQEQAAAKFDCPKNPRTSPKDAEQIVPCNLSALTDTPTTVSTLTTRPSPMKSTDGYKDLKGEQQLSTSGAMKGRSRLDIASSRRLLFGSLGLKTPKTKSDERKVREKLMEGVRSALPSLKTKQASVQHEPIPDCQDSSWDRKIRLLAVECGQNGRRMSTPPFPFVQRWERERRSIEDNNEGVRGKRRKGNSSQYYENCENENEYWDDENHLQREQYRENPGDIDNRHHAKDLEKSLVMDSLIPISEIPNDLSGLEILTIERAKPGATIAFKQMEIKNWSPTISMYRTAKIEDLLENEHLGLTLAPRDRQTPKAKSYDPRTGQQLYSKFEMPGAEEEAENGYLELAFSDMIQPLLIQEASDCMLADNKGLDEGGSSMVVEVNRYPFGNLDPVKSPSFAPDKHSRFSGSSAHQSSLDPDNIEHNHEATPKVTANEDHISDEREQKISVMLINAGFDSGVPPALDTDPLESLDARSQELGNSLDAKGPSPRLSNKPHGKQPPAMKEFSTQPVEEYSAAALDLAVRDTSVPSIMEGETARKEPESSIAIGDREGSPKVLEYDAEPFLLVNDMDASTAEKNSPDTCSATVSMLPTKGESSTAGLLLVEEIC